MHHAAYDYVARFATSGPVTVVEVGARDVNGTTRPLFPGADWWGVDAQPGPSVDEVADGATWQPAVPVDIVVCTEVFEHTPNWRDVVANAAKMLRPGGRAVFTCAGPGRKPHGVYQDDPVQPGWYANVSAGELRDAMELAGFVDIDIEQAGEDTRGTGLAA